MQDLQSATTSPHTPIQPVLDLLAHRLQEPWSVDRLAQALGVSTRTLHRVFMRQYGLSPMTLLRLMRLATARQKLEAPRPGTTVTTVALDSGFVHLSRFSQEYARRFGECPSETLRRARRRAVSSTGHAVSVQASAALEAQRVA